MAGTYKCSATDFSLIAVFIFLGLCFTLASIVIIRHEYNLKVQAGYQFIPGDIEFTTKSITKLCLVSIIAGFGSGLLGMSAGLIIGQVFL